MPSLASAGTSAGTPWVWVAMMAFVLAVAALRAALGQIVKVSLVTLTGTGVAPIDRTAARFAIQSTPGMITESPGLTPTA